MIVLKRLMNQNRIYIKEKTIEQRRDRYAIAANPIEAFLQDAMAEDSVESDVVSFCNKHHLGKVLKKDNEFQEGRQPSGKRETIWKGIKLKEEYNIDVRQETLDVSTTTAATTNNKDNGESNIFCYYCSYQTNITKEYERHVALSPLVPLIVR